MSFNNAIFIQSGASVLEGNLVVPVNAHGLIIFSQDSGSSRHSPQNKLMAELLQREGFATFLFDLVNPPLDGMPVHWLDIGLAIHRLVDVTRTLMGHPAVKDLQVGYFAAGLGAVSALGAAAQLAHLIRAVAIRSGRPDLIIEMLHEIPTPVMLIVGERDGEVAELNLKAFQKLVSEKRFEIVSKASHMFEEAGKLEEASRLAQEWFRKQFKPTPQSEESLQRSYVYHAHNN